MTVAPLTPAAAPFPTTGAAAGTTAPADFLAELLQALAPDATPDVEPVPAPDVEPVETNATPVPAPDVEPVETDATNPPAPPTQFVPVALPIVLPALPPQAAARLDKLDVRVDQPDPRPGLRLGVNAAARLDKLDVRSTEQPDVRPGLRLGVNAAARLDKLDVRVDRPDPRPGLRLGGEARPRLDKLEVREAQAPTVPQPAPRLDGLDVRPSIGPATTPAAAPTASTPPVAAARSVPEQVFGEVTGLVSRGNGVHRITMKLQPEQLGEVRVVLTVREGAVHVRLAAGHDARAALLDGSPELGRLLEHAGATETRIVVRELAATPQTTNQTPTADTAGSSLLSSGDRSPDRHAGTRADHLATDGDDPSRGHRTRGHRDVTPIRSVLGSGSSAVDLTL